MIQYIVQPGDTLYFISLRFKTTVAALMELNHIPGPDMIFPRQILNIPLPFPLPGIPAASRSSKGQYSPLFLLLQSRLSCSASTKAKWTVYIPPLRRAV